MRETFDECVRNKLTGRVRASVAASGDEGGVDVMLPLVVRVAGLGLEHAWPVSIRRSHDGDDGKLLN